MTRLIITIPDDLKERVYDGVAKAHRYQEEIRNPDFDSMYPERDARTITNPESRDDFVKRMVRAFLTRSVAKAEADTAREVAEKAVMNEISL